MSKSQKLEQAEKLVTVLSGEVNRLHEEVAALKARLGEKPAVDPTVRDHIVELLKAGDAEQAQALARHVEQDPQSLVFESWGPGDPVVPGSLRDGWRQQELRQRAAVIFFNEVGLRPGAPDTPDWTRPGSTEPVPPEWAARVNVDMLETNIEDYSQDGVLILDRKGARFTNPRRPKPEDEALARRVVANLQAGGNR